MIKKFHESNSDIVIGSRYLKESKILNWPRRRIIFLLKLLQLEFLDKINQKRVTPHVHIILENIV